MIPLLISSALTALVTMTQSQISSECEGHRTCAQSLRSRLGQCISGFVSGQPPPPEEKFTDDVKKCICHLTSDLVKCIIGKDSKCGIQKRSARKPFAALKRYAANCTALGVDVFPKITDERQFTSEFTAGNSITESTAAGGNSTTQSTDEVNSTPESTGGGNATTESTTGGNSTTESTAGGNSTTESTAGGNSTTESTAGGNSTSSASHASAVVAILFALVLN